MPSAEAIYQHDTWMLAQKCREDYYFFQRYMFEAMKGFGWRHNWHHTIIAQELMKVYRGETKRLIINIPPRYSKTEMAVVGFIAWCLALHPDCEFIHVSYAASLAENNSLHAQQMVQHPAYTRLFDTKLDKKAQSHWTTTKGGVVYATGSAGTITGFGAGKMREGFGGALIIDDPHKPDEAGSDVVRQSVINNYPTTLQSRLNSPDTPVIVIMQRLHEGDLAGWLLANGSGETWRHIEIPAIVTDKNGDDIALWPWKHDLETLRSMERTNAYTFAGQYMQRPAPLGGGIFKTAWWCWYNPLVKPVFTRIIQSWDTAFKTKEQNDYSVCTTWGEAANGYYLIDVWKDKVESPMLRQMAKSLYEKWHPHAVLIEDKASGQGLIQELMHSTRMPVVPIPKGRGEDKVFLANQAAPLFASGRVFAPEGHPELPGVVLSLSQFPNGLHDDDVDSIVQALLYLSRPQGMTKIAIGGA